MYPLVGVGGLHHSYFVYHRRWPLFTFGLGRAIKILIKQPRPDGRILQ